MRDASPRWSVYAYLAALVVACLGPGLVGAALLLIHEYREGHERLEKDTILTARALVQAVDAHLMEAEVAAQSLSTAGSLARGDFAEFRRGALLLLKVARPGSNIVVTDRNGQQIFNTLQQPGQPLYLNRDPVVLHRLQQVLETGEPVISNLFIGGLTKRPIMTIDVPVFVRDKATFVLSIGVQPEEFNAILMNQRLPPGWLAAVFDGVGTTVARTHGAKQFVGQKGTQEFIQRIHDVGEGSMESTTREGIRTFSVFSRSPTTGWSVGIGIPLASLEASLRRSLWIFAAGMVVLFALGISLAWFWAGRIARSVRSLTASALALGNGEKPERPALHIREALEVADALDEASKLLSDRTAALQSSNRSLKESERALLESETLFRAAFEQAAVGMSRVSLDGKFIQVNDKLCAIVGHEREALLALTFQEITHPDDLERDLDCVRQLLAGSINSYSLEKRYIRKDGATNWVNIAASLVRQRSGEADYFIVVIEDIQPRKTAEAALEETRKSHERRLEQQVAERTEALTSANKELERLAHHDALTGLENRLAANERLRFEFLRLKRTGNVYSVLMLDVDHFKRINDTYGHETGDHVLRQMGELLAEVTRKTDFVARFGGEEFLVILPDTDATGAMEGAEKIRQAANARVFPAVGHVTLSIGIATAKAADSNEDEAVRRADKALYRAKHGGRNTIRC
ncbi:sensor domain-containing diguanylate cyclase [Massilia terrae]|uniref:diguanylate cyclase n=1 Tax=Massilia terrae TaxID=1811224 RepID=A0ABT2D3A1_9BURK|nr:diguanylate cyclase [Massilia terrae]MCS0660717.1 diguanylate cyclase [Massilia terrae]